MAVQYDPSQEELQEDSKLALSVLKQRVGGIGQVRLQKRPMRVDHTKSKIYAVNVTYDADKTLTGVPSPIVIKHYKDDNAPRTSGKDTDREEFLKEVTVLGLDIKSRTPFTGDEPVRVYPEAYSIGNQACLEKMTIIREFIPGDTLEQMAKSANGSSPMLLGKGSNGSMTWESPFGEKNFSHFLLPIAILHLAPNTSRIAEALYSQGLVEFRSVHDVIPKEITRIRKNRVFNYLKTLVEAKGKVLGREAGLGVAFSNLDREFVSRRELITIVDGELDVFPHHAMLDKIPDAGGVEYGGIARDLAVYGAPCFADLWKSTTKSEFAFKVSSTYLSIRGQIEDYIGIPRFTQDNHIEKDLFGQGILFASAIGNFRKAAAIVHYDLHNSSERDIQDIENQVTTHLTAAHDWLKTLKEGVNNKMKKNIDVLMLVSAKYGLGTERYRIDRSKTSYNHSDASDGWVSLSA